MTAKERKAKAQAWNKQELLRRWDLVKQGSTSEGWGTGLEFEYVVIRAFEREGATVKWPYGVTYPQKFGTMEQIDGLVYAGERAFLIESKDLPPSASIEAVAKLRFRLEGRPPGTMAILFSTSDFSQPTEIFTQFASPLNVLLWSKSDVDVALTHGSMKEGLKRKLEYATAEGLPLLTLEESQ